MNDELKKVLDLQMRLSDALIKLRLDEKESELSLLEEETKKTDFWRDNETASQTSKKIEYLKNLINPWRHIERDLNQLHELLTTEHKGLESEIKLKIVEIENELEKHESETYFSGQYDNGNAILSIYAGAGGVDAQDWAEMLQTMYLKFVQKNNLDAKIINSSAGTEAGIKSTSIEISGPFAYGLLKSEGGVHRLVRISPFDADKARHTSFALVEVIPEIEDITVDVPEKELKIETFRASGHGGQSVNTTDSAVRITHLPTQTVVICQNERSQLQNKETAMKVLRARLTALLEAERNKEIRLIKGENISAEWGSQIRSYVLHPYQLVKDHRTGFETSDVNGVLSGNLIDFAKAYLKRTDK